MKTLLLFFIFLATFAYSAPFVINTSGTRVIGTAIEATEDGAILLTIKSGQTLTFKKNTYTQAMADKPDEIVEAQALVKQGDFDAAASLLKKIKTDYKFLSWDLRAQRMLARLYIPLEQFENSVSEYEELFNLQPKLKKNSTDRAYYMQALLQCGENEKVVKMIGEDIASGSRAVAAHAQIVRGDMKYSSGQYEEALLDYLRTALLFEDQRKVLPEAYYKTAHTLKKLSDPRADKYFQRVIENFPKSEFAIKAKEEQQ